MSEGRAQGTSGRLARGRLLRGLCALGLCALLGSVLSLPAATAAPVASADPPTRAVSIAGTGIGTYPAFDPDIHRYAITTTADTAGQVQVTATSSDPGATLAVNGNLVNSMVDLSQLAEGDEVTVRFEDAAGQDSYTFIYLPPRFPTLQVTANTGAVLTKYVGLTLTRTDMAARPGPRFLTIIDTNGVPIWLRSTDYDSLDLKRAWDDGPLTVSSPTPSPGRTGMAVTVLNDRFQATGTIESDGLTDTDGHDSILQPDGTAYVMSYEPSAATGDVDAVIQRLKPDGHADFTWNSSVLRNETVAGDRADYAHINSFHLVADDDLIVSFRHFSAVLRIATRPHDGYEPGEIIWKLGGHDSTFTFPAGDGGPCAQHSAVFLPAAQNADGRDHVLLFDNGSDSPLNLPDPPMCIDPADRAGQVERPLTRIIEYALDYDAGTATSVREYSHQPARYAFFAGSVRPLTAGHRLIGWASDTRTLASEIDADDQLVWEIEALPAAGENPYYSYRAAPIDAVPDTIPPTITVTSPANGASYLEGTKPIVSIRCGDRGGSGLNECGTTLRNGAVIDTTQPGKRSLAFTATDAAGNTTVVTRKITVVRRTAQPTATIAPTTLRPTKASPRRTATITIRNAGNTASRYAVKGPASTRKFSVTYRAAGIDVTTRVVRGTYRTVRLAPGQTVRIKIVPQRKPASRNGDLRRLTVRATPDYRSGHGAATVTVIAKGRRHR